MLTMTWVDSEDPPIVASTGALRCMRRNVEINGADKCWPIVRA